MNRYCIVPARGGSQRLKGKNSKKLGTKPLYMWTLDAVAPVFDVVIFTTDDLKILKAAKKKCEGKYDNIIFAKRPDKLSTNTSKVIDTVTYYFKQYMTFCDQIWLALPTCPLRTQEDVEGAIKLLGEKHDPFFADGVLSVTDYEFPPTLGLAKNHDGSIRDWHESTPWQKGNTRSQDHEQVLRPNGALYGMWSDSFRARNNFYKGRIQAYYMPRERSVDIDTIVDFRLAEVLINETTANSKRNKKR